jgi:hypothetical protein
MSSSVTATRIFLGMAAICLVGILPAKTSAASPSAPVAAAAFDNDNLDFTIVNRTGYGIRQIMLSEAGRHDYGREEEALHGRILADGDHVHVHFPPHVHHATWDMKVIWTGNYGATEFTNIHLPNISKLTLHYNARDRRTYYDAE